jgi:hypothetical protein
LTAVATLSDGTTKNVTNDTDWQSSDSNIITISKQGLMKAVTFGTALAEGTYQGQFATLDVRVLPSGTYILTGGVTEPVGLTIDGALVEIRGGTSAGPRSVIAQGGYYTFIGLSGSVTVTASHSGYVTQSETVSMSQDRNVDLELMPTTAPAKIETPAS